MKNALVAFLTTWLMMSLVYAKRAVPFDNLQMSILAWPKHELHTFSNNTKVKLNVFINGQSDRPQCEVLVIFQDFDKYYRVISKFNPDVSSRAHIRDEDIKILEEVTQAAVRGKNLKKRTITKGNFSHPSATEIETKYYSEKKGDFWCVCVQRGDVTVSLSTEKALQLLEARSNTMQAARWYETLLTAEEMPKPNKNFRPLEGTLLTLKTDFGAIERDGLKFSADMHVDSRGRSMSHELTIKDGGRREAISGDWIRDMMHRITEATAAAHHLDGYSFIGRHGDLRYEVTADSHEQHAELRIHPLFGVFNLYHKNFDFNKESAAEISAILEQSERVNDWLDEHGELLFPRKPVIRLPKENPQG